MKKTFLIIASALFALGAQAQVEAYNLHMKDGSVVSYPSDVVEYIDFSRNGIPGYVQLWENGPYFAKWNFGATCEEDFGAYFAWGEVRNSFQVNVKENPEDDDIWVETYNDENQLFWWLDYPHWDANPATNPGIWWTPNEDFTQTNPRLWHYINKYHAVDNEFRSTSWSRDYPELTGGCWYNFSRFYCGDGRFLLSPIDDIAYQKWNGGVGDYLAGWRMPRYDELNALLSLCDMTWETVNGVNGVRFWRQDVEQNDSTKEYASIFMPCGGFANNHERLNQNIGGYYWSSTLGSLTKYAKDLNFNFDTHEVSTYESDRYIGRCIRPVKIIKED